MCNRPHQLDNQVDTTNEVLVSSSRPTWSRLPWAQKARAPHRRRLFAAPLPQRYEIHSLPRRLFWQLESCKNRRQASSLAFPSLLESV